VVGESSSAGSVRDSNANWFSHPRRNRSGARMSNPPAPLPGGSGLASTGARRWLGTTCLQCSDWGGRRGRNRCAALRALNGCSAPDDWSARRAVERTPWWSSTTRPLRLQDCGEAARTKDARGCAGWGSLRKWHARPRGQSDPARARRIPRQHDGSWATWSPVPCHRYRPWRSWGGARRRTTCVQPAAFCASRAVGY